MLQKKYEDYLPELYNQFPDVKEDSIKSIIEHGLKKLYDTVKTGNDVRMSDRVSNVFIGWFVKDIKVHWKQSKMKEHTKRRRLFLDEKTVWDRWHYFGLTEEENNIFQETEEFPSVYMYKILRECIIRKDIKYIYKTNLGYTLPQHEVPWGEPKESVKLTDCELSEEGKKILNFREYKKALNLTYKNKNEKNCTE